MLCIPTLINSSASSTERQGKEFDTQFDTRFLSVRIGVIYRRDTYPFGLGHARHSEPRLADKPHFHRLGEDDVAE